uniref:Uncharacterized protein n=1 Tax=Molossus molossus TaxID=27622 RepID=A0A7J8E2E6_MOLMO|nr:hypothetical protein HJG59_009000 [Molossus molossus]
MCTHTHMHTHAHMLQRKTILQRASLNNLICHFWATPCNLSACSPRGPTGGLPELAPSRSSSLTQGQQRFQGRSISALRTPGLRMHTPTPPTTAKAPLRTSDSSFLKEAKEQGRNVLCQPSELPQGTPGHTDGTEGPLTSQPCCGA